MIKKISIEEILQHVETFLRTASDQWENGTKTSRMAIHRVVFTSFPSYDPIKGFRTAKKSLAFSLPGQLEGVKYAMADKESNLSNQLMTEFMRWHEMLKPG